jgi:hypothetical protein
VPWEVVRFHCRRYVGTFSTDANVSLKDAKSLGIKHFQGWSISCVHGMFVVPLSSVANHYCGSTLDSQHHCNVFDDSIM